ncbi:MAG: hypothetical protein ACK41D_12070 [Rubricoccaceae bacterium]
MIKLLGTVGRGFDAFEGAWESERARKTIGLLLVAVFGGTLLAAEVTRQGWAQEPWASLLPSSHFQAIGAVFTALLVVEAVALTLALPRSIAEATGKQFELFSLILLRAAFKEIGRLPEPITWVSAREPMLFALADAGGALLVFGGVVLYERLQRHRRITAGEDEQRQFVLIKKVIAAGLLFAFAWIALDDAARSLLGRPTYPFFETFFTVLIFSDVLIVLVSLRYADRYAIVFRNAGFALSTVVLRVALVAPPLVNVGLGLAATAFVVVLTMAYNAAMGPVETAEPAPASSPLPADALPHEADALPHEADAPPRETGAAAGQSA